MLRGVRWLTFSALVFAVACSALYGRSGDQVHFAQSIVVSEDETVGNLVCIGCSIHMAGTSQDIVAIGGSIQVDGRVEGDTVAMGGAVRLGENASVAGDVVSVGGRIWRDPNAIIKGDVSSQSGALVIVGLFLVPLIPVILVIALVVWLVGRNRRNVPAQVRPTG